MIEQFTDEELRQIRKELAEQDGNIKKPYDIFKSELAKLFDDRPYHAGRSPVGTDIPGYILKSIDNIVSLTLDCSKVNDLYGHDIYDFGKTVPSKWHQLSVRTMKNVPADIYPEYVTLYEEIINLIEKHIKPYERFTEVKNEQSSINT